MECFQSNCSCPENILNIDANEQFLNSQSLGSLFTPVAFDNIQSLKSKKHKKNKDNKYFSQAVVNIEFTILPENMCCLNFEFFIESNFDDYQPPCT